MASSPSPSGIARSNNPQQDRSRNVVVIAFLLISALYFADTLLRASLKTFWFDEIITVLLCRLPSFGATWAAVLHGVDFNPPLFYVATRAGQFFTGDGLIASRLPGIIGFWIFCICIYFFVRRRLGPLQGCVAALFPLFTLAHTYSYEARPQGMVLGWCGLMLVCWQRVREGRNFSLWTLALFVSALGALLTHVYTVYLFVPFLAVEALGFLGKWRLHAGALIALLLAPPCVAPLYLEMMHRYRAVTSLGGLRIHPYEVIQHYLVAMVGPALVLLLVFLLLLAVECSRPELVDLPPSARGRLLPEELWLAALFGGLVVIGAIGVKISHGPFFSRYFLAAAAGYAILLAQATVARRESALVARGLIVTMLFLLVADIGVASYCRWHHADLDQIEPASLFPFPPDPHLPLRRDAALLKNHGPQDILVTNEHTYLYLYFYGTPELRRRLYLGYPEQNDPALPAYQRESSWLRLKDLRAVSFANFFSTRRDFYAYTPINGVLNGTCQDCLEQILEAGYTLQSVDHDTDNLLEHYSK